MNLSFLIKVMWGYQVVKLTEISFKCRKLDRRNVWNQLMKLNWMNNTRKRDILQYNCFMGGKAWGLFFPFKLTEWGRKVGGTIYIKCVFKIYYLNGGCVWCSSDVYIFPSTTHSIKTTWSWVNLVRWDCIIRSREIQF